jgi:hypothetical protein
MSCLCTIGRNFILLIEEQEVNKMPKEHTFEDSVEEIRQHRLAREAQNRLEEKRISSANRIKEMLSHEQLCTWKVVESLIAGEINKDSSLGLDKLRERLMGGDGE